MFLMHLNMSTYFYSIMCQALSLSSPSINLIKNIAPCLVQTLGWSEWAGRGRGNENVWFTNYAVRGGVRLTRGVWPQPELARSASSADSELRVGGSRVSQSPVSVHHLRPQDPRHHHHRDLLSDQWPGDQGTMSRSLMGSRRGSLRWPQPLTSWSWHKWNSQYVL